METSSEGTNQLNSNKPSEEINGTVLTYKSVTFKRTKMYNSSLTNLNDVVADNSTKDITLVVNNQKLTAHKNVLASNCDYFDRMFTSSFKERDQDKVEINITDVSYETLNALIGFFYTSVLVITEHNVQDLLIGSNIFLLDDVREACVDYIKSMIDDENCINMKDFANSLGLNDLYSLCLKYIENNFRLVANTEDFMTMNYEEIMLLIKNDNLFAKEEMVYDVVLKWIKHDPATRSKYIPELLWYVRMPLVLNTYQGVDKVHEFQGARTNSTCSFRMEHRKPFRKGILIFSHYPFEAPSEWYDAALDQWQSCMCENCLCKKFQMVLAPPQNLSTCILLNDGRLFAAGGYEHGKAVRFAYIYDLKLNKWIYLCKMHFERIKPYIVQIGRKVFVIGGCTATIKVSHYKTIEYYDLKKKKWFSYNARLVKGCCTIKFDTYVTCVNGLIYIIGPTQTGFYNPQNNSWHVISQLPDEISEGSAICTLNNKIYLIGGNTNDNYCKNVWSYCTETKVWMSVADMNSPRSHSGAVAMNGLIYVFGGKTAKSSYSKTFEVYDPHNNNWVISYSLMTLERCYIDAIVIEKSSILYKKVFEDAISNIVH